MTIYTDGLQDYRVSPLAGDGTCSIDVRWAGGNKWKEWRHVDNRVFMGKNARQRCMSYLVTLSLHRKWRVIGDDED